MLGGYALPDGDPIQWEEGCWIFDCAAARDMGSWIVSASKIAPRSQRDSEGWE